MSFRPEVIADSSGQWCGNTLRFATREEAETNVQDLMMRWFAVRETRVVASDDSVNYRYVRYSGANGTKITRKERAEVAGPRSLQLCRLAPLWEGGGFL